MRIVHVNDNDLFSNRFNGHDMQIELNKRGIQANQFVMTKWGENANTIPLTKPFEEPFLRGNCVEMERKLSINAMVYPYGWRLLQHPVFHSSSIAHYHLFHNHLLSMAMLSELTSAKPTVFTIHDPWIFSGHCIYSLGCNKWRYGCGDCPDLDLHFPMLYDNTEFMWKVKKKIFSTIDIDIVVASKYMLNMIQQSPITKHFRNVHHIPFGIDVDLFSSNRRSREAIRHKLDIPQDHFVMFCRAETSPYKGFNIVNEMLDILTPTAPLTLVTVGEDTLLEKRHLDIYNVKQFGRVTDDSLMADLYCACDVFLMTSQAEAFGLMAIETMASSRPLVVMDGTSLPDVTFAPECGICISRENPVNELKSTIERLMQSPDECRTRGEKGRELAERHYRFEDYVNRHVELYKEIIGRKK
ncbi:MAG: glycosyltransferase [Oscillospiraceae bacterium]|nr:glycosyltransferase [Oscillospiraceae bacterium]